MVSYIIIFNLLLCILFKRIGSNNEKIDYIHSYNDYFNCYRV